MLPDKANARFLFLGHLEALDGLNDRISFLFERAIEQGNAMLRVKGIAVDKVIRNGRGGFTEHVGNDRVKGDVADGEGVLKAVLLAGLAGNQLVTVAGTLAEDANPLFRDKAAGNETEAEEIADPFGILDVVLVALDGGNPFGVSDGNADGILQQIIDWNVVLAGALHADIKAVVFNKPLLEGQDGVIEGGKAFFR